MANFETAYAPLKEFEGGYSNDPNDRGGETYAGIARNFFPGWQGWEWVDDAKQICGSRNVGKYLKGIPELQELVSDWYRQEWWDRLGLAALPQALANEIFEQAVNLGRAGCGKKVQTICNAYNYDRQDSRLFPDLVVDGAIGPKTLGALRAILAEKAGTETLVHALNCMQGTHYLELAARKHSQRKFINGWMKRTHCEGCHA